MKHLIEFESRSPTLTETIQKLQNLAEALALLDVPTVKVRVEVELFDDSKFWTPLASPEVITERLAEAGLLRRAEEDQPQMRTGLRLVSVSNDKSIPDLVSDLYDLFPEWGSASKPPGISYPFLSDAIQKVREGIAEVFVRFVYDDETSEKYNELAKDSFRFEVVRVPSDTSPLQAIYL